MAVALGIVREAVGQGLASGSDMAPRYHHRIAVLSHNHRVDAPRIHAGKLADQLLESCGFKSGTGSDYPGGGQARQLADEPGHHVHRVRDDDKDSVEAAFHDFGNDAGQDRFGLFEHRGPVRNAVVGRRGCQHDDIRIPAVFPVSGFDRSVAGLELETVLQVHRFAFRFLLIPVDQDDFARAALVEQRKGGSGADCACSDNDDLGCIVFHGSSDFYSSSVSGSAVSF